MNRECWNCGKKALKVVRNNPVRLIVMCFNCGEINAERDYTDEAEYHDDVHGGNRKKQKYDTDDTSDERPIRGRAKGNAK